MGIYCVGYFLPVLRSLSEGGLDLNCKTKYSITYYSDFHRVRVSFRANIKPVLRSGAESRLEGRIKTCRSKATSLGSIFLVFSAGDPETLFSLILIGIPFGNGISSSGAKKGHSRVPVLSLLALECRYRGSKGGHRDLFFQTQIYADSLS